MLPSIPVSEIVSVNPSALGTGGNALALNTAILHVGAPYVAKEYNSAAAVADDYGLTSSMYRFSQVYFNGFTGATVLPSALYVGKYNEEASSAALTGASLRSMTLEQLKTVNGSLNVTVDGGVKERIVDLSTATSFSNAAEIIETALVETVEFNTQLQAFVIKSKTTGTQSSISYATGVAAAALGLTQATGASLDNATDVDTPASAMNRIVDYTLNFAVITHSDNPFFTTDVAKEIAAWVTAQRNSYWFVQWGQEPTALIANSDVCFGAWLKETVQSGTTPIYGELDHAALACAYAASINFNARNGRTTLDFRGQAGIAASITNASDAKALESNGYAFYGAYAARGQDNRFVFMRNSVVSGEFEWVDTYLNQVYFNSQLQLANINLLINSPSIPYNAVGKELQRAAARDPINQMLNFGGIQTGVILSEQQKAIINSQAGYDAATEIFVNGFALYIGDASTQVRGQRGAMPEILWYTDGGSVHSINIASIAVL